MIIIETIDTKLFIVSHVNQNNKRRQSITSTCALNKKLARLTGLECSYGKFSSRSGEISVEKSEISVRRAGSLVI